MKVYFRKVLKKDWDYILKLRNDYKFRTYFYHQHTISEKEHYNYLKNQKSNPNFYNLIICNENKDVGYVRILDDDIGIIIDSKFQKKGIGTKALQLLEAEAKKLGHKKLIGKVMVHNKNSKKLFEKNSYKLKMYWFEKEFT